MMGKLNVDFSICLSRNDLQFRIILESDPNSITQRVQLRQDDIPLGEQTMSQVRFSQIIFVLF